MVKKRDFLIISNLYLFPFFQSEKKNGGWVLMIGNVRDSTYAPKIIQSFLPKSEKIRSPPNSTDDPGPPKFLSKSLTQALEPVCCKKQQKKVPDQLLVCGIGDLWRTWMIPNWLYMSPSDSLDHPGSILYHSESSEVPYSTNQ